MTKVTKAPAFKMLDEKAIATTIASIAKRGKTLERDIHIAAVSTLNHADKCGDTTLAQRLVCAVPSLARKNALRDWFVAMGKFKYDVETKTLRHDKAKTTNLELAIATPFWEFKQEAAYVPFDMQAAIISLVKRADKAMQHGDKVDKTALAQLAAIAGTTVTALTAKPEKATKANTGNVKDVLAA